RCAPGLAGSWVISWPSVAVANRVSEDDPWGQAEPFDAAIVVQQNNVTSVVAHVPLAVRAPGATVDLHHCGTCLAQPVRIGVADECRPSALVGQNELIA